MSLLALLIAILIAGGLAYLLKLAPIDQIWKTIGYAAIVIFFLLWLFRQLRAAGIDMTI